MKVSILTVVYNDIAFIGDCINSIQSQSYSNLEHIIVDGGSTDGTLELVHNLKNDRTIVISEPDKGIYDAMNKGIRSATGKIIGILNSDDLLYDNQVLNDVAKIFGHNDIACLYGNLIYVDRSDVNKVTRKWISCPFRDGLFEKSWTPAHPTFYCRSELFEKYGLYRLDFEIAADVELMYRFLQKYRAKSFYFPRMMVKMRNAGVSNKGIKSTIKITREMRLAINENGGRFNLVKYLFFKGLKTKQVLLK